MKKTKFAVFGLTVLTTSVIVFNEAADLSIKLFSPTFNLKYFIGWGVVTLAVITYIVRNLRS